MRIILTLGLFFFLFCSHVYAHNAPTGWAYDPYCCNGDGESGDCQMIPSRTVKVVQSGYQVMLEPGDHRLVTRNHTFMIPQRKTMHSPDGAFHLCLFPDENTVRCFYAPDMDY